MNIAEILKNCPKGMKLYSLADGEVELVKVNALIHCSNSGGYPVTYYSDGKSSIYGECMLFPSMNQRDWSEFVIPFEDGDVIITTDKIRYYPYENVAIFKGYDDNDETRNKMVIYCQFDANGEFIPEKMNVNHENWRKATDEERKEFFDRLHKEGYDFVNGSLVKRFKYGDVVAIYNETFKGYNIGIFDEYINDRFCKLLCVTSLDNSDVNIIDGDYNIAMGWDTKHARYANHAEKIDLQVELAKIGYEWKDNKLVKVIKPTFGLGDVITDGKNVVKITSMTENFYGGYDINNYHVWSIPIVREKDWKLTKFDINSLKPYDRVLVRDEGDGAIWYPTMVSYVVTNGVYTIDSNSVKYQVIPFEGHEHLIGKSSNPDRYYVTWYSED